MKYIEVIKSNGFDVNEKNDFYILKSEGYRVALPDVAQKDFVAHIYDEIEELRQKYEFEHALSENEKIALYKLKNLLVAISDLEE